MLRSYLTTALRTLWKHRGTTAINALGLAAGLAVCLLMLLVFWEQRSLDRFHPGAERIYRITTWLNPSSPKQNRPYATSPAPLAPILRAEYPGIEAATRLTGTAGNVVHEKTGYQSKGYYAESSFFEVFGFTLVAGHPEDALAEPHTAVVSQRFAERVFGSAEPVGQTLYLGQEGPYVVTGVVERASRRSHLAFDVLYSYATLQRTYRNERQRWVITAFENYTYARLRPGTGAAEVNRWLDAIRAHRVPSQDCQPCEGCLDCIERFGVQALTDIPMGPSYGNDNAEGTLPRPIAFFLGTLALVVLLAASFNYVNLSVARSLTRSREVGIRKALGAQRWQITAQFVTEAILVALGSLMLALLILPVLREGFNRLWIVEQMGVGVTGTPGPALYGIFASLALLVGLGAGLYPGWVLARFEPSRVLKASAQTTGGHVMRTAPRKALIALQFGVTLLIASSAAVVYQQSAHFARADYGIRIEGLAYVRLQDAAPRAFQQEALQVAGVERVGLTSALPGVGSGGSGCKIRSARRSKPFWATCIDPHKRAGGLSLRTGAVPLCARAVRAWRHGGNAGARSSRVVAARPGKPVSG